MTLRDKKEVVRNVVICHETEKAYLFKFKSKKTKWYPKSAIEWLEYDGDHGVRRGKVILKYGS
tara:strand:+ start:180 stop:368 length:189 start_codon:yes stop_codon:yes gene_type:complete